MGGAARRGRSSPHGVDRLQQLVPPVPRLDFPQGLAPLINTRILYPVRLSATIANEYMVRCVFCGDDDSPYVPAKEGTHHLPLSTVREIHEDAEHQVEDGGFARDNCTGPGDFAIRSAYVALRHQTELLIRSAPQQ